LEGEVIDESGNLIEVDFQEAKREPRAQPELLLPINGDVRTATDAALMPYFDGWWNEHCWIKRGIGAARTAYIRVVRDGLATPQQLADGADAYAAWHKRNPSRQPIFPTRWLDEKRWGDDQTTGDAVSPAQQRDAAMDEAARRYPGLRRSATSADPYWNEWDAKQRAARRAEDEMAAARAEERAQRRG
jgi:hypothetical protein